MAVVKNAIDLIGNTPMYRIPDTNVYVELEKYNAGGSVKDRAVLGMLQDAQEKGLIKNDTIIVEATSGNTGIALAMLGAMLSIKTIIIMPESMSKERRELIKAYGAQLILTPKELGMKGALGKAQEILDNYPNAVTLGQFVNPANPHVHYETTAKEILRDVPNVGIFVAGIGTGGTFTGVTKALKEQHPYIKAVAVEPEGSPVISRGTGGVHKIQGIGAGFIPENFDSSLMDEVQTVTDEDAIEEVANFMRETGIGIGISSAAAIFVARQYGRKFPDVDVVVVAPDGVEKYLSMIQFESVDWIHS